MMPVLDDLPAECFRAAFEHAGVATVIVDAAGRLAFANDAFSLLLGLDARALRGRPIAELLVPGERDGGWELPPAPPGAPLPVTLDQRYQRADGTALWARVHCVLFPPAGERPAFAVAHLVDVGDRLALGEDPVTGLPSAARFDAALAEHLRRCRRYGAEGAVMLVGLDGVRSLDAETGDDLLRVGADLVRRRLRGTDLVVRATREQLRVLLDHGDPRDVARVARELANHLEAHPGLARLRCPVGAAPLDDPDTPEGLLGRAAAALEQARRTRGDTRFAVLAPAGRAVRAQA